MERLGLGGERCHFDCGAVAVGFHEVDRYGHVAGLGVDGARLGGGIVGVGSACAVDFGRVGGHVVFEIIGVDDFDHRVGQGGGESHGSGLLVFYHKFLFPIEIRSLEAFGGFVAVVSLEGVGADCESRVDREVCHTFPSVNLA